MNRAEAIRANGAIAYRNGWDAPYRAAWDALEPIPVPRRDRKSEPHGIARQAEAEAKAAAAAKEASSGDEYHLRRLSDLPERFTLHDVAAISGIALESAGTWLCVARRKRLVSTVSGSQGGKGGFPAVWAPTAKARAQMPERRRPLDQIVTDVADECGVRPADMRGEDRTTRVAHARHRAMSAMRDEGYMIQEIARFFGRHETTVSGNVLAYRRRMARAAE